MATVPFLVGQQGWLSVQVQSAGDGEKLEKATVVLDGSAGGFTNEDGSLVLQTAAGPHQVEVRYLNFKTYRKEITVPRADTLKLKIAMESEVSDLEVVVISASQYEKKLEEETVSVEVIDNKLVKNNNATELGEAIDKSVGVQAQDGQITIRGGSAWAYGVGSRTAVLVDGLPFVSADLGEPQMKHAPLEILDQIEVLKGTSSVVYGSSALNGVVHLRTAWPGETPQTEFTIFNGVYGKPTRPELKWWDRKEIRGFNGMFFSHRQRYGNWDAVLGGNINQVRNYLQGGDENRIRLDAKTRYHSQKHEGLTYGLNANIMAEKSGRFYLASDLDSNAYRLADGSLDQYLRWVVDPHFNYLTPGGTHHRVLMRWMHVFREGTGDDPDAVSDLIHADYQYQRKLGEHFTLTAGVPASLGFGRSNLYPGLLMTWSMAGYAQGEYSGERLSVIGGARLEASAVDVVFATTQPVLRLGANYRVGKNTFMRASWGQAYRLPTIGERFISATFSIIDIIPNANLKPERGWGLEYGVRQPVALSKWKGYVDFAAFWNEYDNFVDYTLGLWLPNGEPSSSFDDLGLKPQNVNEARIMGFEVSGFGQGKIGPIELRTLLGYTYTYPGNLDKDTTQQDLKIYLENAFRGVFNRYEDVKNEFGYVVEENSAKVMNFRMRHLFKADIELGYKDFSLGYTLYAASFPERWDLLFLLAVDGTTQFVDEHANTDFVHGIRGSWQFSKIGRASLLVKNLTNHEYLIRPGRLEPPRNFTLQLNFLLKGKSKTDRTDMMIP
jgi:iron complex outermembrane receptor protein